VVRGDADQDRVAGSGATELDGADHVGRQVPVAEDGGLRGRGGAAGVEQHRRSIGVEGHLAGRPAAAPGGHEVVGRDGRAAPLHQGVVPAALPHHHHVAERLQQRVELLGGQPVVERHERDAGGGRCEQPDRERQPVGADVGHRLTALDQLRAGPGRGQQLGCGEGVVAHLHGRALAPAVGGHLEEEQQVHVAGSLSPRTGAAWRPSGQHLSVDGERSRPGPAAEQLQAQLLVRVALADGRAVAQRGVRRAGGAVGLLRHHRRPTAADLHLARRRPHDDHLRVAHGAEQLHPRSQLHGPPR
jgi:hypothetical protein